MFAKKIQYVFSKNSAATTGYSYAKIEFGPLCHKINQIKSKWILNIRKKIRNLLEEIVGKHLYDLKLGNVFIGITPKM